jgi:hypothetical protein
MKIRPMPVPPRSHPDRAAATLANLVRQVDAAPEPWAPPGPGAADCRIDIKLLQWRAQRAMATCPASREHLQPFAAHAHPDLWAGTVQDGTARGFAARLEEAIALAGPEPAPAWLVPAADARVTTGKELRRRKDLLVASGGPRVRFTKKEGVLFVDRDAELHSSNCLRFEARADHGSLDDFAGAADERPRLFSAQFLQPAEYHEGASGSRLLLRGRIGRGPSGWDVAITLAGRVDERQLHVRIAIQNRLARQRLRVRWLGIPSSAIAHDCTPVREVVDGDGGGFVAFTLVRANDVLLVDGAMIAVPAANCEGTLVHDFHLGTAAG